MVEKRGKSTSLWKEDMQGDYDKNKYVLPIGKETRGTEDILSLIIVMNLKSNVSSVQWGCLVNSAYSIIWK